MDTITAAAADWDAEQDKASAAAAFANPRQALPDLEARIAALPDNPDVRIVAALLVMAKEDPAVHDVLSEVVTRAETTARFFGPHTGSAAWHGPAEQVTA